MSDSNEQLDWANELFHLQDTQRLMDSQKA